MSLLRKLILKSCDFEIRSVNTDLIFCQCFALTKMYRTYKVNVPIQNVLRVFGGKGEQIGMVAELLKVNKSSDQPLYLQLYNQLHDMIINKQIPAEYKLPPIRKLSNKLSINSVTVVNAYKLLENNGLVYSKVGSGTYVMDLDNSVLAQKDDAEESPQLEEIRFMDRGQIVIEQNTINFASATPTPELFPTEDFKNALNEVLERDKGFAFGYQESQGFYPLRESIATYLSVPDSAITPEEIQIISGAQQGIDILAKALLDYGDYLIVESPTYTGAIAAFRSRGAHIIEVPLEHDGINLNILEDKIKRYHPRFIYCMPNFQNPTGYCYSLAKRRALLNLANRYELLIVEDDYLTELDYGQRHLPPLRVIDHFNRVIYIKSFSKIFMPGLRLAFLTVPQELYNNVLAAKHISDISTPGLIQRAFDIYLRKGIWRKQIDFMREIYKERYYKMLDAVKDHFPDNIEYIPPEGGLTFWFGLPEGYLAQDLYKDCLKKDVLFIPGSVFYPTPRSSRYFRLSFAAVYPDHVEEGIKTIARSINKLMTANKKNKSKRFTPLL